MVVASTDPPYDNIEEDAHIALSRGAIVSETIPHEDQNPSTAKAEEEDPAEERNGEENGVG